MAEKISVRSSGSGMSLFKKIPWTLAIILYMLVVHFTALDMRSVPGYIFLGLCVVVLFIEFFKSGDIGTFTFLVDLLGAVFSLVLATALMSYLIFKLGETPTFFHWFGCAVILGDTILGPFNAFRTALRNLGLGAAA
jgi:drug/metabolite transporter (DMT)-like permease